MRDEITIGRQEIENEALARMQQLAAKYELGIAIDQVQLKNVNPPGPVQESFNEVNQAIQEKERLINEAWADYNQTVPSARGEAERVVRAAEGYALVLAGRRQEALDETAALLGGWNVSGITTYRSGQLLGTIEFPPGAGR